MVNLSACSDLPDPVGRIRIFRAYYFVLFVAK